jgi:hypothetical protein
MNQIWTLADFFLVRAASLFTLRTFGAQINWRVISKKILFDPHRFLSNKSPIHFAGESGKGNTFLMANGTFKMKMDIDRHGPRLMPSNCKNLNPPYFSLPSTFKKFVRLGYLRTQMLQFTIPFFAELKLRKFSNTCGKLIVDQIFECTYSDCSKTFQAFVNKYECNQWRTGPLKSMNLPKLNRLNHLTFADLLLADWHT